MRRHVRARVRTAPRCPLPQARARSYGATHRRLPLRTSPGRGECARDRRRHRRCPGRAVAPRSLTHNEPRARGRLRQGSSGARGRGQAAVAAGLRERMTRRRLDLAATPDLVEPHDIVVLHRVVCCYPDYERLLTAAADRATRALVFSHPPRNALTRAMVAGQHLGSRLTGRAFRVYSHPPAAMVAVAERRGLRTTYRHRGRIWRIVALERTGS